MMLARYSILFLPLALACAAEEAPTVNLDVNSRLSALLCDATTKNVDSVLSESEIAVICQKRDLLLKQLQEDVILSNVRDKMYEQKRQEAVKSNKNTLFPLTAEEIAQFRAEKKAITKATNQPIQRPLQDTRSIYLDLANTSPIDIYVAPGYVSSLVFYDQNGEPWPITQNIIGNAQAFTATTTGEQKNIIALSVIKNFSESNALLHLASINTPIVIRLIGTDRRVDARVDIRVPRTSPSSDAQSKLLRPTKVLTSRPMIHLLSGRDLSTLGAQRYRVTGVQAEAWILAGQLYLRTEAELSNPEPIRSQRAASGFMVYELQPLSNLLFLDHGQLATAHVAAIKNVPMQLKPQSLVDKEISNE